MEMRIDVFFLRPSSSQLGLMGQNPEAGEHANHLQFVTIAFGTRTLNHCDDNLLLLLRESPAAIGCLDFQEEPQVRGVAPPFIPTD